MDHSILMMKNLQKVIVMETFDKSYIIENIKKEN